MAVLKSGDSFDAHFHGDRSARLVHAVAWRIRDFICDVLALDYFAKNGVAIVEMSRGGDGDKKLAPIGVRSGVGHGEFSGFRMLQGWMEFIGEGVARTAAPVSAGAAALDHELRNHAVESQAVVIVSLF